jgi:RinA family phage transcriptional activator
MVVGQQLDQVHSEIPYASSANFEISEPINILDGVAVRDLEKEIRRMQVLEEIVKSSINDMLNEDQKILVDLIYFQKLSWWQICDKLVINKNTYYKRKNELIKILAKCFNYIPDEEVV